MSKNNPSPISDTPSALGVKIGMAESGGGRNTHNPHSSAMGPYQHVKGTFNSLSNKYHKTHGRKLDSKNPKDLIIAQNLLEAENRAYLNSKGIKPTDQAMYAAHMLGPSGSMKLQNALRKNPNQSAASLYDKKVVDGNKSVFYDNNGNARTAKQVEAELGRRLGLNIPGGNETPHELPKSFPGVVTSPQDFIKDLKKKQPVLGSKKTAAVDLSVKDPYEPGRKFVIGNDLTMNREAVALQQAQELAEEEENAAANGGKLIYGGKYFAINHGTRIHATGGPINYEMRRFDNGGDVSNGLLNDFNEGGSHEQNPNGGIPQGRDAEGTMNTVEEGETRMGDYIFSDRLIVSKDDIELMYLPKQLIGKTFADASKYINSFIEDNPFDILIKKTATSQLDSLQVANDRSKQITEAKMGSYSPEGENEQQSPQEDPGTPVVQQGQNPMVDPNLSEEEIPMEESLEQEQPAGPDEQVVQAVQQMMSEGLDAEQISANMEQQGVDPEMVAQVISQLSQEQPMAYGGGLRKFKIGGDLLPDGTVALNPDGTPVDSRNDMNLQDEMNAGATTPKQASPGTDAYTGAAMTAFKMGADVYSASNLNTNTRNIIQKQNVGTAAASGAMQGAAAGMAFGPLGAAIGGVVGGGAGLASSLLNNKAHDEQSKKLVVADYNAKYGTAGGGYAAYGGTMKTRRFELGGNGNPKRFSKMDYDNMTNILAKVDGDNNEGTISDTNLTDSLVSQFNKSKIYTGIPAGISTSTPAYTGTDVAPNAAVTATPVIGNTKTNTVTGKKEEEYKPGKFSDPLKYALPIGVAAQYLDMRDRDGNPYRSSVSRMEYKPKYWDTASAENIIASNNQANNNAILNASEGSAATARAGMLANGNRRAVETAEVLSKVRDYNNAQDVMKYQADSDYFKRKDEDYAKLNEWSARESDSKQDKIDMAFENTVNSIDGIHKDNVTDYRIGKMYPGYDRYGDYKTPEGSAKTTAPASTVTNNYITSPVTSKSVNAIASNEETKKTPVVITSNPSKGKTPTTSKKQTGKVKTNGGYKVKTKTKKTK